jgi:VWFA-related protein
MKSPSEGDILYGPVEFAFDVAATDPPVQRLDIYLAGRLIGSATPPEWLFRWDAPRSAVGKSVTVTAYTGETLIQRIEIDTRLVDINQEVRSALVQLFPVVLDKKGNFVSDLRRDEFRVLDQGAPVGIENFSVQPESSGVAMLLDVSESMEAKLSMLQDASLGLMEQLKQTDELAVYAFNQSLIPMAAMGSDPTAIEDGILELQTGGGTALYDALFQVLRELRPLIGRKIVLIFSDGKDERSLISLRTVIRAAHESSVIVFVVALLEQGEADRAWRDMQSLAEETGGQAFLLRKLELLGDAYEMVVAHMRAQYALSYRPPEGEAGLRPIEVDVTRSGLEVNCRKSYLYTPPPD